MTQGTLVRKLCTYDADPTRQAVFEYDTLVRSIDTLRDSSGRALRSEP